jgi:hypothetical protein
MQKLVDTGLLVCMRCGSDEFWNLFQLTKRVELHLIISHGLLVYCVKQTVESGLPRCLSILHRDSQSHIEDRRLR